MKIIYLFYCFTRNTNTVDDFYSCFFIKKTIHSDAYKFFIRSIDESKTDMDSLRYCGKARPVAIHRIVPGHNAAFQLSLSIHYSYYIPSPDMKSNGANHSLHSFRPREYGFYEPPCFFSFSSLCSLRSGSWPAFWASSRA